MSTLAVWVHDLNPFVWRISGDFGIRWYGLAYIVGFVLAYLIMRRLARRGRLRMPEDAVPDLMLAVMIGTLVGGRLGYVLVYNPSLFTEFTSSPPWWGLLAINNGGMASHGGVIGIILGAWWFSRRYKVNPLHTMDALALVAPIGIFLGRVANFINGELLGRMILTPNPPAWAIKYPQELTERRDELNSVLSIEQRIALEDLESMYAGADNLVHEVQKGNDVVTHTLAPLLSPRHPSQLYQAFFEGLLLLALLWIIWRRPRRPGVVGAWFLIIYGVGRIFTEFYRLPDAHLLNPRIMGLSRGQWLSAAMVVAGAVILGAILALKRGEPVGGWGAPPAGNRRGATKTGDA